MKYKEAQACLQEIIKSDYVMNDNELQNAEVIESIIQSLEDLPDSEALFLVNLYEKAVPHKKVPNEALDKIVELVKES